MSNSEIINIIFRFINFAIVIFLIIYVFKKYLLSVIKKQILEKNEKFIRLKERYFELVKKYSNLDKEIINQKESSNNLINKINVWNNFVDNQIKDKNVQQDKIKLKLNEKFKKMEQKILKDHITEKIVPEAIQEAKNKLEKEFQIDDNALKYQNNLIELLKKNNV